MAESYKKNWLLKIYLLNFLAQQAGAGMIFGVKSSFSLVDIAM